MSGYGDGDGDIKLFGILPINKCNDKHENELCNIEENPTLNISNNNNCKLCNMIENSFTNNVTCAA